ncbi:MAG: hypothetical protein AB8H12_02790 [Lewinella sp.]
MRFLLTTLFIISSLFSCALFAQEEGYDEMATDDTEYAAPPANAKLNKIAAKLQLTDEQLPQVTAILEEFSQQAPPTTPEEKKARRRALRTRVMALLTPEQKALVRQGRPAGNNRKAPANGGKTKRNWFEVLLDDVAMPLMNQRKQRKPGPNN